MESGGEGPSLIRRRLAPTLAVCLVLLALELGLVPDVTAVWTSNLLQLGLAAAAAALSFRAAARERALARAFFALPGAGLALWAAAQAVFTLTASASPPRPLVAVQDFVFVGSAVPLIAACALRPHRPRPGALGLAADVGLVCVLMLFLHAYFASADQALGAPDPSPESPLFFNPQRLMVLGGMLWLRRGAEGAWRRLYDELGLAMVLFLGGGVLPNLVLSAGTYRPGLLDIPWTLPFLWVALAAREWPPQSAALEVDEPLADSSWEASAWKETRRGNALALSAVALVPAVHQLATLLGSAAPPVHELRGHVALVGTLLVGGLYLVRQLQVLRRAERTQATRERRFRALVENSADATFILDRELRFAYLSASTARVTGHAPDALAGSSPLELVHPDELDTLRRALREVASRARARAQGFVRYRHADGSFRHGAIDAVNLTDTPAVGGLVLHLRDVTEQRHAEEERARSLSLLEATLESTADGLLVVDRQGRLVRFNRRLATMWRFPYDEIVAGRRDVLAGPALAGAPEPEPDARILEHILDQLAEPRAFLAKVEKLNADPEAESFDTIRFKDGRVFERYSLPQRLAGEVVGRVWSFRDVSERARAEQAMARLVAILEATPDFVLTCDAALRPLYVNRAGRRMVGLADDEPLGERHTAQFHPAGAAARLLEEAVPGALREGAWSGETLLRHRDGREIPVLQVWLAHRSESGEVDFLSSIARDISQRIEAEQRLRRGHTMAALGSLVAGVAHEVRNPLFGISSTLDAFEARFAAREDHRPYVQVLREQLGRLTGLMNDLLEYAKPTRLELEQARLEPVVEAALAACAPLAEKGGVVIDARLPAGLPPLRLDPRRLGQVLHNLVENALQHSPGGGRVRLEARLVSLPPRVVCTIDDDGPGFQPGDLPHLFEPFFTRRHGGTGLGLSIVQRIVADHDGSIDAENRPEGGARLTLTLPVPGAPEAGA